MSETGIVTKARRVCLCEITSGKISTLAPITHVALGSGGIDSDGEPIQPLETDTALKLELDRFPIIPVEYPVDTTARYTVIVPKDKLNEAEITEAALVDSDGTLCAIKTMYVKKKDPGVTFTFDDEF